MKLSAEKIAAYKLEIATATSETLKEIATELELQAPVGRNEIAQRAALSATIDSMLDTEQEKKVVGAYDPTSETPEQRKIRLGKKRETTTGGTNSYFDKSVFGGKSFQIVLLVNSVTGEYQMYIGKKNSTEKPSENFLAMLEVGGVWQSTYLTAAEFNRINSTLKSTDIPAAVGTHPTYAEFSFLEAHSFRMDLNDTGNVKAA